MQKKVVLLLIAVPLLGLLFYASQPQQESGNELAVRLPDSGKIQSDPAAIDIFPQAPLPEKAVLDISVHTIDELRVVLDRAEGLAMTPQPPGSAASVILVLHGPEVEFFAISNYDKYKDIVDQAARLDAFDVVDVRICQAMLEIKGIPRDDIPAFIEQVPLGTVEIERLVGEGYVYF